MQRVMLGVAETMRVGATGEDVRYPSAAATPDGAYFVWTRIGSPPALRVARVVCRRDA